MGQVFLYGGCVVRDGYDRVKEQHKLLGYVSRQSLISAMNQPTKVIQERPNLASPFQNRMVEGDINSDLRTRLRRFAPDIDLLVMDLNVERLGVHKLEDGSFITRSAEIVKSGLLSEVSSLKSAIEFGTERHSGFLSNAVRKFKAFLEELDLLDRTLVIHTPWAQESVEGLQVRPFRGHSIYEMNKRFNEYKNILENHCFRVVSLPNELALTTEKHKWGMDAFHFAEQGMQWVEDQIQAALQDQASQAC